MHPRCAVAFMVAASLINAHAGINFTPTTREYVSEGITYREVNFQNDSRTVRLELPSGWSCRGTTDRLELFPTNASFVDGVVQAIDLPSPQPIDESAAAGFVQAAIDSAPPSSQNVAVVEQGRDAIIFNGAESFGVTISYQTLGQTFRRSNVVINLPERRLLLRFAAPEKQFDLLNRVFQGAIRSWDFK